MLKLCKHNDELFLRFEKVAHEIFTAVFFCAAPAFQFRFFRKLDQARMVAFRALFDTLSRVEIAYAVAAIKQKALFLSREVIVVQVFRYRSCIRIRPSPRHKHKPLVLRCRQSKALPRIMKQSMENLIKPLNTIAYYRLL